jgi:hypothetical protein
LYASINRHEVKFEQQVCICLDHFCLQTIQIWTLHLDEAYLRMLHNLEAKEVTIDLLDFLRSMYPVVCHILDI